MVWCPNQKNRWMSHTAEEDQAPEKSSTQGKQVREKPSPSLPGSLGSGRWMRSLAYPSAEWCWEVSWAPAWGRVAASQKYRISGAWLFQVEDLKEISAPILGMWGPCLYAPLYTPFWVPGTWDSTPKWSQATCRAGTGLWLRSVRRKITQGWMKSASHLLVL